MSGNTIPRYAQYLKNDRPVRELILMRAAGRETVFQQAIQLDQPRNGAVVKIPARETLRHGSID